jgi:hypothetical protein
VFDVVVYLHHYKQSSFGIHPKILLANFRFEDIELDNYSDLFCHINNLDCSFTAFLEFLFISFHTK